ncbi:MAG: DDE-type integrase/transposase/recombinase [Thaumarchaeota archaeon]|nr:DDE-type integrase/transposase/recombinase [Nitrososphaerota archaeon]
MSQNNPSGTRMTRAISILENNSITESKDGSFTVPSQSNSELSYRVELLRDKWVCSCPDFQFRGVICKHCYAVQFQIALKQFVQAKKPSVVAEDAVACKFCESIRVMRCGYKSGKQVFKCKDCRRKFVEDSLFKRLKYDPELITVTLDLYFKGISLRKISDHLKQMYEIEINFSTIYKWIDKYVAAMDAYVRTLTPKLSGDWHVDEMYVKARNGIKLQGSEGQYKYLWNILDKESRFQLASEISKTRNELDARNVFKTAREIAKSIPKTITSDKAGCYPMGIETAFLDVREELRPSHNRVLSGAATKKHGNQLAERINNTVRERNKVQRGWKKDNTPLRNGQMIYYNFVRPHTTLEGKTPAQVAGIGMEGQNKWLELLKKALATENRN